jgi:hypothetical protein
MMKARGLLLCRFLDACYLRPHIERFSTSHPVLSGRYAMAEQIEYSMFKFLVLDFAKHRHLNRLT